MGTYNLIPEYVTINKKIKGEQLDFDIHLESLESLIVDNCRYITCYKYDKRFQFIIKEDLKDICWKYFPEYMI